ncbi:hypothetical protein EYR40_005836 [Pleurotus pulmonarius]|nr:hypothetical protein EYR36_005773 [Pleurotus pulmonarius]KAF4602621.1 hypothetical protein EYR40_005836 [Pleurotus pulmonarius]
MSHSLDTNIQRLKQRLDRFLVGLSRRKHAQRRSEPPSLTVSRVLPGLPLELWTLILRHACTSLSIPDPLDTSQPISFLTPTHLHRSHYAASMRQKCNFSLVSKRWHSFTQEVLYEFVWISCAAQAKALALTLLSQACQYAPLNPTKEVMIGCQSGRYIRRLHIETSTLERCDPTDLRTILDYSPQLLIYSDQRSIRRSLYASTAEKYSDHYSSPQKLLSALAHPNNNLRRLSWTNYDDASFHLHMSPTLRSTSANLEFLELTFVSANPPHRFPPSIGLPAHLSGDLDPSAHALALPNLRSLKVTLDNDAFSVLSTWSMPRLVNLSVVSADFSYAGEGFAQFFRVHGSILNQLELGHSSSSIEEHWLTSPAFPLLPNNPNSLNHNLSASIPLAKWCPNLTEFICSADAEWNWRTPDWIAPHILLPAHPTLQFIGIRDIDLRMLSDLEVVPDRIHRDLTNETPFFRLKGQIETLLGLAQGPPTALSKPFPGLKFVRDMSLGSHLMRMGRSSAEGPELRVVKFWANILDSCRGQDVWLEDCYGVNVTRRDLGRAKMDARV